MRLGLKDRRVIEAFIRQESANGLKLDTDGHRLDGAWMGGSNIASWNDGSIEFHDLGSRSAQTVQNAVRKAAKIKHQNPTFWIQGALAKHKEGALHRQLHKPVGEKFTLAELRAAKKRGGRLGKRANLALTLRGFRKK